MQLFFFYFLSFYVGNPILMMSKTYIFYIISFFSSFVRSSRRSRGRLQLFSLCKYRKSKKYLFFIPLSCSYLVCRRFQSCSYVLFIFFAFFRRSNEKRGTRCRKWPDHRMPGSDSFVCTPATDKITKFYQIDIDE